MTACLCPVSFLYTFLCVGTWETELEKLGNLLPRLYAAPWLPDRELQLTAGKQIPNRWFSKSKEKPTVYFPDVKEIPFWRCWPQTTWDSKMVPFLPHFPVVTYWITYCDYLLSSWSWWKTPALSTQDYFSKGEEHCTGFLGKEIKQGPPRC